MLLPLFGSNHPIARSISAILAILLMTLAIYQVSVIPPDAPIFASIPNILLGGSYLLMSFLIPFPFAYHALKGRIV
jgi:hypothetical protein